MCDSDVPLPDDVAFCHEIIRQQAETIRESQRRIEQLEHQVEQLLRRQYGPRRESVDPDQLRLFADEAPEGQAEDAPEEPTKPEDAAHARRSASGFMPRPMWPRPRAALRSRLMASRSARLQPRVL